MLMDLVLALVEAVDPKDKEKAYRRLEKVGVDRKTADIMAAEFYKEEQKRVYRIYWLRKLKTLIGLSVSKVTTGSLKSILPPARTSFSD